jgi:drug/metabolite transporter (DMT)-like permease
VTPASLLALGSSLGWGISDYLGGVKSRTLDTRTVLLVSQVVSLVLLAVGVVVLRPDIPAGGPVVAAVLAGVGELVGVAALYRGLAVGVAGVVSPTSAAAPAVALAAGLVIGELPTALQGVALVVLIAGIVLTAVERGEGSATGRVPASVGYGALSALGFGGYYVAMDVASRDSVPWALFIARLTAVAVIGVGIAVARTRPAAGRRDLPVLALIGALIVVADAMYATASRLGELTIVAVLAAFHPVVTIAMARIHTGQPLGLVRRIGVAAAVLGLIGITAT